ncbi:integrating conjugative element protein [Methyloterricola oryzae]|uniref:integrating conjugative element protein n=1 Tax=Methyloterricola oryzae TaxID=1495050 RepID=UPI0005EBD8E5|nr:integrating conjugative element protein [Methyloterricola oryzae]
MYENNQSARLSGALTLMVLAWSAPGAALDAPSQSSNWYYRIGGAAALSPAANPTVTSISLLGSVDLRRSFSCGNFSPLLGISNIMNQVKNGAYGALNQVQAAVTGAVANLPQLILQRASPGLYDLLQNALLMAQGVVSLNTKSCEQVGQEIAQGKDPFDKWITLGKGYDWKVEMGSGGVNSAKNDVVAAKENVDNNAGKNGVPWIGGLRAGGTGQKPVRVIYDSTVAGYNIELGRGVSQLGGGGDMPLADVWGGPEQAAEFARFVLGDADLFVDKDTPRATMAGHGLRPMIEREKIEIQKKLRQLVSGDLQPNAANLEAVSAPGTLMTREVVLAMQRLPDAQARQTAIVKLAEEAATRLIMERALLLRRLLLSGRLEPNIYASPASEELLTAIGTLDKEIDNLLYETRIRRELFSQTSSVLLDLGVSNSAQGDRAGARSRDPRPVSEGAPPAP